MDQQNTNWGKKKKTINNFAKYSGLGVQMLGIILLGVLGGQRLDKITNKTIPVFTIIFSLIAVFAAIYLAVKDFIKHD